MKKTLFFISNVFFVVMVYAQDTVVETQLQQDTVVEAKPRNKIAKNIIYVELRLNTLNTIYFEQFHTNKRSIFWGGILGTYGFIQPYYSVNFEKIIVFLKDWMLVTGMAGFSYHPVKTTAPGSKKNLGWIALPAEVNLLLGKKFFFETGIRTYYYRPLYFKGYRHYFFYFPFNIGFRYQLKKTGPFFKIKIGDFGGLIRWFGGDVYGDAYFDDSFDYSYINAGLGITF